MAPARPRPATRARRCAVLAGGRGSRLGGDKAARMLAGRPLIDHVLGTVREAGLLAVVVSKPGLSLRDTTAASPDVEILLEPPSPTHPLLGIATALAEYGEDLVVCPCDTPLLPAALLAELAGRPATTVVAGTGGSIEPLIGRYPAELGPRLRAAAERGQPARAAIEALDPHLIGVDELARFGDPATILANVNTRADLAALEPPVDRGAG